MWFLSLKVLNFTCAQHGLFRAENNEVPGSGGSNETPCGLRTSNDQKQIKKKRQKEIAR